MRKRAAVRNPEPEAPVARRVAAEDAAHPPDRALSTLSTGVLILAILAGLYALYAGEAFVLPVVLAVMLKLLFQPVVDFLCAKLKVPAALGALLLIACLFTATAAAAFAISGPASGWIQKAPELLPALKEKLALLRQPLDYLQGAFKELEDAAMSGAKDKNVPTVVVKSTSAVTGKVAAIMRAILGVLFTTLVILFFLLAAGDRLLRGLIEVLPRFADKRQAVDIATEIQRQIGGYLLTITMMNTVVGVLTGLAMWACGLGDPVFWGICAFLLNYVPILGPVTGTCIFLAAGIMMLEWPWHALLPAALYLCIHVTEGELVTPFLLAQRFTLNPVLVIGSVFFWDTLWGVPGALLAVPLLAMFKIVCDRVEPLKPVGHVIGS